MPVPTPGDGNAAFAPAEIWALDRTRAAIETHGAVQRRIRSHLARRSGQEEMAIALDETPILAPTHWFAGPEHSLDVGGRPVTFRHLGRGHTDNDMVVVVDGVVFAGDLVEEGAPPAFEDSFPVEWAATLAALVPIAVGPVVPGHGAVVDGGFVAAQRALMAEVARVARSSGNTVPGLPDDVAGVALTRARAEMIGNLHGPTPEQLLAEYGLA